jgi:hypothetical protein
VKTIHELGLSAFMNAYFVDHLFSSDDNLPVSNGPAKNPQHLASLLDHRDAFLLESFIVKNGQYESADAWQARLNKAIQYRARYGTRIFATTTTTPQDPFSSEKFNYAWWSARLYGIDGFSWGEPDFAAANNNLPDRQCGSTKSLKPLQGAPRVDAEGGHLWNETGTSFIVVDTNNHQVWQVPATHPRAPGNAQDINELLKSASPESHLTCSESR